MLSVIDNVLLEPFPYADQQRLFSIVIHDLSSNEAGDRTVFPPAEFLDYREQNRIFDDVMGVGISRALWTTGGAPADTVVPMPEPNSKATIVSMAVLASAAATLLHEGLGHGATAWLRGDIPTELTSNHLSAIRPDRWVDAAGTLINLLVGSLALLLARAVAGRANLRYFFWILAALNLLPGTGYFVFSGIFGFGDWQEVIRGLPHQGALRTTMTILGAALYVCVVRLLAIAVKPFVSHRSAYNAVGRLPYYAACLFSCAAGALDPLGLKLFLVSTIPAAFGGSSGLLWADAFLRPAPTEPALSVSRQPAWWIAAVVLGILYIVVLGRGWKFAH